MQHVLSNSKASHLIANSIYTKTKNAHDLSFTKFISWCGTQEHNRLLWMALSFCGLVLLALPTTALPWLLFTNNDISWWIVTCSINVPVIAITLAAQPTRFILPIMFISWAADVILIAGWLIAFLIS